MTILEQFEALRARLVAVKGGRSFDQLSRDSGIRPTKFTSFLNPYVSPKVNTIDLMEQFVAKEEARLAAEHNGSQQET